MTSKLEKQKQILSLLNIKLSNAVTDLKLFEISEEVPDKKKLATQRSLLNQVYHFQRSIIQNINLGLVTIGLDGKITFANKIAAGLLGYAIEEILEKNLADFFLLEEEASKFLRLSSIPGRKIDDWECRFVCKNGQPIIVGINASPLHDINNDFEGVVILFRDLTEIHHLRKQVERMERLAMLGELAAGIAHEIRNPLAGIKAATQVLEESFDGQDFRSQLSSRVVREVDRANQLLKEFFKFARPTKPKPAFHSLEEIIDSVHVLLAPRLKKQNIKFQEAFRSKVPRVYVDESQIEQVILNVFLNAIEALTTVKERVLRVSSEKKKISLLDSEGERVAVTEQELNYVVLEIADTGPGISPKNLDKIFNPFFTTKPEGLGLGLSICSRLVEENLGKIDVVSRVGEGSTFRVALPTFVHR